MNDDEVLPQDYWVMLKFPWTTVGTLYLTPLIVAGLIMLGSNGWCPWFIYAPLSLMSGILWGVAALQLHDMLKRAFWVVEP